MTVVFTHCLLSGTEIMLTDCLPGSSVTRTASLHVCYCVAVTLHGSGATATVQQRLQLSQAN